MRSRSKGQGMIGAVLLFSAIVVFGFVMYFIAGIHSQTADAEVSGQVDYQIDKVKKFSVVTSTLRDRMSKAGEFAGFYSSFPAYKVITHYFSTDGDRVYFQGRSKPRPAVKSDIKEYLRHKMRQHYMSGFTNRDYRLRISEESGDESISVGSYEATGKYPFLSVPLAISSGQKIRLTLWTAENPTYENVYVGMPT